MSAIDNTDFLGDFPFIRSNTAKSDTAEDYKIVSVRLRLAEFESFAQQAHKLGLTHNLALRIAIRRIAGFLEIDEETRQLLRQTSTNIGEISYNLGRLGRAAENDAGVDMQQLNEQRKAFGRASATLDDSLQSLLNTAERRLDGRAMLKDAAGL